MIKKGIVITDMTALSSVTMFILLSQWRIQGIKVKEFVEILWSYLPSSTTIDQ